MKIPFKEMWRDKMLNGQKVCTSRTKVYGIPGQQFEVFGHRFMLTKVESVHLENVCAVLYKQEGCKDAQEFYDIWAKLHPRKGFVHNQIVYVHWFALVGD